MIDEPLAPALEIRDSDRKCLPETVEPPNRGTNPTMVLARPGTPGLLLGVKIIVEEAVLLDPKGTWTGQ